MTENAVDNYGWSSERGTCATKYITPAVSAVLVALRARRVVDLGSGNGALCAEVAKTQIEIVGVEYDAVGVDIARKFHPNIPFYNFGVQDDPGELLRYEAPFDVVISTEVVEHLFSPHLLPIYAHAVLTNGGHFVISTPYHGYLKNLALSIFGKWDKHLTALWHGGHIKFWSKKTLSELLERNGFLVVQFLGVGRFPYFWKSMILVAKKV